MTATRTLLLTIFPGLLLADTFLTPDQVDYSDALLVDHQDVVFDANGEASYNAADAKLAVTRIKASTTPNDYTWIPLGSFVRSRIHEITVSSGTGQHSLSSASIKFAKGWSNVFKVHSLDVLNQSGEIQFYKYTINNSRVGIIARYQNKTASQNNPLTITHTADVLGAWAAPDVTSLNKFYALTNKESGRLYAPNAGQGSYSSSFGLNNTSSGANSFSGGNVSQANYTNDFAFGWSSTADSSILRNSNENNHSAVAIGYLNDAEAASSTAIGYHNEATNRGAIAMGWNNKSDGLIATSIGWDNTSSGIASFATGRGNLVEGDYSFVGGFQSQSLGSRSVAIGNRAKSLGYGSTALGSGSEAHGSYAFAGGGGSDAIGNGATAIGQEVTAEGSQSVAMGFKTMATGNRSVAIGNFTRSEGFASAAFGINTFSTGRASFATGDGSVANNASEFVTGQYNLTGNADSLFVVGNGTNTNNRSNALTINRNGDAELNGNASFNGDVEVSGALRVEPAGDLSMGVYGESN